MRQDLLFNGHARTVQARDAAIQQASDASTYANTVRALGAAHPRYCVETGKDDIPTTAAGGGVITAGTIGRYRVQSGADAGKIQAVEWTGAAWEDVGDPVTDALTAQLAAIAAQVAALAAQLQSEAARDVAYGYLNRQPDTTTGLSETTEGQYFSVAVADGVQIYRNVSGVAVADGDPLPSKPYLDAIVRPFHIGPTLPVGPPVGTAVAWPWRESPEYRWRGDEWRATDGSYMLPEIVRKFYNSETGVCGAYRAESSAGAESFWLLRPVGGGLYEGWQILHRIADTVSRDIHTLRTQQLVRPLQTLNWNDASVVRTGTWSTATDSLCVFGNRTHSETVGDSVTWTTPENTTVVGARSFGTLNGGMIKVLINTDPERATLLPKASELVSQGRLADSALVANGGTFNPDDRVWNLFLTPANRDVRVLFADDLDPGEHEIELIVTGYEDEDPASTGARLYLTGLLYQTTSTTIASPDVLMWTHLDIGPAASSVYEGAKKGHPTGETFVDEWMGNTHGNERQDSLVVAVDGVVVDSSNSPYDDFYHRIVVGELPTVTRESVLLYPGDGSDFISMVIDYVLLREWGLMIYRRPTPLVDATMRTMWVAMYPIAELFDKCSNSSSTQDYVLTDNNNLSKANAQGHTIYAWQSTGRVGVYQYCPDLLKAVFNFIYNSGGSYHYWEDRSGGDLNKGYLLAGTGSASAEILVAAGETLHIVTLLGCKLFADADTALARP